MKQISQQQNETEEELCACVKVLARMGCSREDIIQQVDNALGCLAEQLEQLNEPLLYSDKGNCQ